MAASFAERPQGPAVVCMGRHPVPPDNVATWIAGSGREIAEETGFIFWYPCYPDGREEAAFLTHNIAYWRFFGALPALSGPYRWNGNATDSLQVEYHHPAANSTDDYRRAYAHSTTLRELFAQSVAVIRSDPKKARALLDEWAEATKIRFRTGRRSTVCLQTWTSCPTISGGRGPTRCAG